MVENGIGNLRKGGSEIFARAKEQTLANQMLNDSFLNDNKGVSLALWKLHNAGSLGMQYLSVLPAFFYGNTIELEIATKASMIKMAYLMQEANGKEYRSGNTVDGEMMVKDFKGLEKETQESIMRDVDREIQRNYSTTNSKSNIIFLRNKNMNFLRGWTNKYASNVLLRTVDQKSLIVNQMTAL